MEETQRSVGELKQWLAQFGEQNKQHYQQNQFHERPRPIQGRIRKFETQSATTGSTVSSSADTNSPQSMRFATSAPRTPVKGDSESTFLLGPVECRKKILVPPPSPHSSSSDEEPEEAKPNFASFSLHELGSYADDDEAKGYMGSWEEDVEDDDQWAPQIPHDSSEDGVSPASVHSDLTTDSMTLEDKKKKRSLRDKLPLLLCKSVKEKEDPVEATLARLNSMQLDKPGALLGDVFSEEVAKEDAKIRVTDSIRKFGGAAKQSAVQKRREALERKWAQDRLPTFETKRSWSASKAGGWKKTHTLKEV